MKKTLLSLICMALAFGSFAQRPPWRWAEYGANTANSFNNKVATDAAGTVLSATNFAGTIRIGDSGFAANGVEDVIISSFDRVGKQRWSLHLGDTGVTTCRALAIDKSTGEVYIGGSFRYHITFGAAVFYGKGSNDIFLAKYTAAGTLIWAQTFGSFYNDELGNIQIDSRHNLVLGGTLPMVSSSPPTYDSINFGSIRLKSNGNEEQFIAKCDSSGRFYWAINPGGKDTEHCYGVQLDSYDNIIICGEFSGNILFSNIVVRSIDRGLFGGFEFIAKFDSSGHAIWAKAIGGIGPSSGSSFESMYPSYCAVDAAGNAYIGGNYTGGTLIFDSVNRSNALPGGGQWLAKYSAADGKVLWTKKPGSGGFTRAMASDRDGNLYLTGNCSRGAVYGTDTVQTDDPRLSAVFVLKYDSLGAQQWLQYAGDLAGASGLGIAAVLADQPVVVGSFGGGPSIDFGSTTCYNSAASGGNGFVAQLRPDAAAVANQGAAGVQVYPNPARRQTSIESPGGRSFTGYRMLNALGQQVVTGTLKEGSRQRIDLPELAAGMYYLELTEPRVTFRARILIQP